MYARSHCLAFSFEYLRSIGSVSNDWGNSWIKAHAQACIQANKPCLFEEYGITSGDKCSIEGGWQKTALSTAGTAGDLFW